MTDLTSERDRRVRELLAKKDTGKNPNEIGVLSQGQAEIQNIQSELGNNIALQGVQDQSRLQTTGVISQAAEGMLAMEDGGGGDPLSRQVGGMSLGTQTIMQKYGVKPENSRKASSNSYRSTSGLGTTNIKTENITNNKTDIKITQPQIPISQPQIPVSAPKIKTDNTAKFKTWLSGMFAKQQNDAEIQKKEYRKKEWNLARTTTRLMKRIESAASNMTSRLDPQVMTSTLGGQLKWLLLLFGATMIGKVWKPAMKFLANLEGGFRAVFGLPINADLAEGGAQGISIIDKIKDFIGIKKGENTTLIGGIGKVFMEGIDKLINKLKFWFEDRATAIRDIEFPEIETPKINIPGFDGLMQGLGDTLKGVGQYLGDLLTVALGGSKGKVRAAANHIRSKAVDTFTDMTGKTKSNGDDGLLHGGGRNYMRNSDFGFGGILKGNASSTQAMSRTLSSLINDSSNVGHTAEIASGVQQLFDVAKRNGQVIIDPAFLSQLGFDQNDINQLKAQKGLIPVPFKIIQVHPSRAQLEEDGNNSTLHATGAGLTGAGIGAFTGAKMGAAGGSFFGPVGTVVGGGLGAITGGTIGYFGGSAIGHGIDESINQSRMKSGLVSKLVPINSSEVSDDGSPAVRKTMFALTKAGADAVAAKFMSGAKNRDIDLANQEFYERIRRIEERKKRANGVRGNIKQKMNTNELLSAQAQYRAYEKEWYDKFESNSPYSENMRLYPHYNAFTNNMGEAFDNVREWSAEKLHSISGSIYSSGRRGFVDKDEQKRRVNYALKTFIDHGLTKAQAAGIVGNLIQEGLFLKDLGAEHPDGTPGTSAYGPSAGIAQFHDAYSSLGKGELGKLKKFARERGLDWTKFETQIQYLLEGSSGSMRTIEKIRRLQGSDAEVAAESAFQWGYNYEKFAGYNNREGQDHSNRRTRALQILKEDHDLSDIAVTHYTSEGGALANLSGVGGTTEISESSGFQVAWLGDSQTVISNSGFPKGVIAGLNRPMAYFGVSSANATHYLGKAKLNNRPATNLKNLAGKSCAEALEYILSKKPTYCILALGHNGTTGLQTLVHVLHESGIKAIIIKMWAIDGRAHGMATLSSEEIASRYNGISADSWVDLTWLEVDKLKDGVHASASGCKQAAEETVHQLLKGERTTWQNVTGSEEGGILSGLAEATAGAIDGIANFISPYSDDPKISLRGFTANLNKEQRKLFNKEVERRAFEEELNIKSWEDLGAKTDSKGTYFQTGNVRAYVKTDGHHNGLFGLKQDDIDFVYLSDEKGNVVRELKNDDEISLAKKTVSNTVNSIFNNYEEKTKRNGYYDYMTNDKGNPIGFYIGEFRDIDSFKDFAKKDFGGEIKFWIYPTKDLKSWNMVGIGRAIKCSAVIEDPMNHSTRYYGPIIYHKGATWIRPGTWPSQKQYVDTQPICLLARVKLTPTAQIEATRLLRFLDEVGEIYEKDGKYYKAGNQELTEQELELARKYGITPKLTPYLREAKEFNTGIPSSAKYHASLGIKETKEAREKFYKEHKDKFQTVDGILYGPNNVKWGTVNNKGEVSFYGDKTEGNTKSFADILEGEGRSGLEKNHKAVEDYTTDKLAKGMNIISRDRMADFLIKSQNREGVKLKGSEDMFGVRGKRALNIGNRVVFIPYNAFIKSDGSIYKIKVYRDGLESIFEQLGLSHVVMRPSGALQKGVKSFEELDKEIINYLKKDTSLKEKGYSDTDFSSNSERRNKATDEQLSLSRKIINKGIGVKEITNEGIVLKDNTILKYESKEGPFRYGGVGRDKEEEWITNINKAVATRNRQVFKQLRSEAFKDSGLDKMYQEYAKAANEKKMEYKTAYGNYVATNSGDVFGTKDSKGNITAIGSEEAYKIASDYFNQEGVRQDFYKSIIGRGLKKERGQDYYEQTIGGKKYRVEVDLSKGIDEVSALGPNALIKGGSNAQVFNDLINRWMTLSDEKNAEIMKGFTIPMENMVKGQNFTSKMIERFKSEMASRLTLAQKNRVKQLQTAIDQKTAQNTSNRYLKEIAEAEADSRGKLDKLQADIKNIQDKGQKDKQAVADLESFANLQGLKGESRSFARYMGDFKGAPGYINMDKDGNGIIDEGQVVEVFKRENGQFERSGAIQILENCGNNQFWIKNTDTGNKYKITTTSAEAIE